MRKLLFLIIWLILVPGHGFAQNIKFAFPLQNNTSNISPYPASCTGSVEDRDGNHYIVGNIVDTVDVDPGPDTFYLYQPEQRGDFLNTWLTNYLIKYSKDGELIWAKRFYGAFDLEVSIDISNNIILTGYWGYMLFSDQDQKYDTLFSDVNRPFARLPFFLLKINTDGKVIRKKTSYTPDFGNSFNPVSINSIASDNDKNYYFGGTVLGTHYFGDSLDPIFKVEAQNEFGTGFIAKYDSTFKIIWVRTYKSKLKNKKETQIKNKRQTKKN